MQMIDAADVSPVTKEGLPSLPSVTSCRMLPCLNDSGCWGILELAASSFWFWCIIVPGC